jgi:hypothetical protein
MGWACHRIPGTAGPGSGSGPDMDKVLVILTIIPMSVLVWWMIWFTDAEAIRPRRKRGWNNSKTNT